MYNNNAVMDWNDVIEDDGQEFVLLEEGDYNFRVTNFERGHFPGSAKLPACNKATLTLEVDTREGCAYVKHDLLLCRNLEWRISSFFVASARRSTVSVWSWTGIRSLALRAGQDSSPVATPTVMVSRSRPTIWIVSMTTILRSFPRSRLMHGWQKLKKPPLRPGSRVVSNDAT